MVTLFHSSSLFSKLNNCYIKYYGYNDMAYNVESVNSGLYAYHKFVQYNGILKLFSKDGTFIVNDKNELHKIDSYELNYKHFIYQLDNYKYKFVRFKCSDRKPTSLYYKSKVIHINNKKYGIGNLKQYNNKYILFC